MRPGLLHHRKFARLARLIGSEPLAVGSLEMLWSVAYENGDDLLGDAGDVEHLARWAGEAGMLAEALVSSGFLDESPEGLRVHDLWDHAPSYVTKRAAKEVERQERGETIRSLRSQAGKKGAAKRWQMDDKRNPLAIESMANGRTPAPAPAPAQKEASSEPGETPAAEPLALSPPAPHVVARLPVVGEGPQEFEITDAMEAEWRSSYPGVNIHLEILHAVQWARDNPKKRKTHAGARRFLGGWLARAQDRPRSRDGPEQPRGPTKLRPLGSPGATQ